MLLRMPFKQRIDIRHFLKQLQKVRFWHSKSTNVTQMDLPDKSEGDRKIYRALSLANGTRAMLISDPGMGESNTSSHTSVAKSASSKSGTSDSSLEHYQGKLAACAVLMSVGSFYEPPQYQGLAHFLEHMIFMGSEKYPIENAFDSFVTKSGGFSNAHTENEDTCFYFEVEEQHLDKTLDMFMHLMKEPLMSIDAMARERSALQSEFEQTHMIDEVRRDQILASMASDGYPHATFSWGNLKSLQENVDDDDLHKTLHAFRRNHYGANRMTVCLQAQLSLDELEELLVRHCSTIPKSEQSPLDVSRFNYREAFREQFFRQLLLVQPVEDVCKVEITWVLPAMRQFYRCKPDAFLSQLLGYEGVGSLCSYLRRRLWCMSVIAGVGGSSFETNSIYSLFTMSIYLTDEGFEHLDEVMAATFAWIRMLNECNTLHSTYKEMQQIAATNFRFQIELPSMDNVQSIVEALRFLPPKDVLTGTQLYFEYDDAAMSMLKQHLNEFRFNIMISSHIPYEHLIYDQVEPWFGTHYTTIDMPAKWQAMWSKPEPHPELKMPEQNQFITTDFTVHWIEAGKPHVPRRPKALIKNDLCELWFRPDDTFLLPDGFVNLYFITPIMRRSPHDYMSAVLYTYLVEFSIAEQLYPALVAGLTYGLDTADKGLVLRVSGYNQKLPLLLEIVMNVMQSVTIDPAQVMSFKELKKRQIFNALITGRSLNLDLRLTVLEHMRFTLLQKYHALETITVDDIQNFKDNFYKKMYVQGLIQGNFTEQQARDIMQKVHSNYQSEKVDNLVAQHNRLVQLPLGEHFLRVKTLNEDDPNTIVSNYYQIGPCTLKMECLMDLVDLVVEEPFFNQLRTKEQLGYSLGVYQRIGYGILAYILNINTQENKHTAEHVEARLEAFRSRMPELVAQLTDQEFDEVRETLINGKKLADYSLDDEVMRNWSEIVSMDYFFNRTDMQIQTLNSLTKDDVVTFLLDYDKFHLRKLSVQVIGASTVTRHSTTQSISDAVAARQSSVSGLGRRTGSLAMLLDEVQRNISEEQLLFEQIGDRIRLEFIGVSNDPSHITDIAAFKKDLLVYPFITSNPKLDKS
ncbi:nardilysin isoform X1 [Drosophila novamexicana]|uniref:nardilysin isoform X1 n=2 Tax=Drosophila novamexicana TaxID=47314 RepID=UPI0011E5FA2D|nr:nardilysin isoform X1 [Drosophila novamexicana]